MAFKLTADQSGTCGHQRMHDDGFDFGGAQKQLLILKVALCRVLTPNSSMIKACVLDCTSDGHGSLRLAGVHMQTAQSGSMLCCKRLAEQSWGKHVSSLQPDLPTMNWILMRK